MGDRVDDALLRGWRCLACGHYIVIRVGNPVAGEWTNVGVAIYGPDGQKTAQRFDSLDRAIRRGDWPPGLDIDLAAYAPPTMEDVRRIYDSTANHITRVQITEPRACLLDRGAQEILDRTYSLFVRRTA